MWSELNLELLQDSFNMVYSCVYMGQMDLQVINVKTIISVVAQVPMTPCNGDRSSWFFLLEKPGLEITHLRDVDTVVHDE